MKAEIKKHNGISTIFLDGVPHTSPAVFVKKCDGYTSVFFGSKSLDRKTVKSVAKFAGVIFIAIRKMWFILQRIT